MTNDQYRQLVAFLGEKFGEVDARFASVDRRLVEVRAEVHRLREDSGAEFQQVRGEMRAGFERVEGLLRAGALDPSVR